VKVLSKLKFFCDELDDNTGACPEGNVVDALTNRLRLVGEELLVVEVL